jgi:hypothetical protein
VWARGLVRRFRPDTTGNHSEYTLATPTAPANDDILSKHPGVFAWLLAIVTGVGFLGALYVTATSGHDDGGHGEAAEHAAPAEH